MTSEKWFSLLVTAKVQWAETEKNNCQFDDFVAEEFGKEVSLNVYISDRLISELSGKQWVPFTHGQHPINTGFHFKTGFKPLVAARTRPRMVECAQFP